MKTILAFVGGGDRDRVILQTALAAARPLAARIDCLHAHVPAAMAARYGHSEFARGDAIRDALQRLGSDSDLFSTAAAANVQAFCSEAGIDLRDPADPGDGLCATFREEPSNDRERLTRHAQCSDLVVIGRARQRQGLPPDTLEHLLRQCGKPVLVAAESAPRSFTATTLVGWKDDSTAVAVRAAAPLLAHARRLVFVGVGGAPETLAAAARAYGGGNAESRALPAAAGDVARSLAAAADDLDADLVVMAAYGRSRARELLFGSTTDALLDHSNKPILLLHGR